MCPGARPTAGTAVPSAAVMAAADGTFHRAVSGAGNVGGGLRRSADQGSRHRRASRPVAIVRRRGTSQISSMATDGGEVRLL